MATTPPSSWQLRAYKPIGWRGLFGRDRDNLTNSGPQPRPIAAGFGRRMGCLLEASIRDRSDGFVSHRTTQCRLSADRVSPVESPSSGYHEQGVGLPVFLVEAMTTYMEVLVAEGEEVWIEGRQLQRHQGETRGCSAECFDGVTGSAGL